MVVHHEILAFVERMGLTWEIDGLPRIAGRIFELLLVTPSLRLEPDPTVSIQRRAPRGLD